MSASRYPEVEFGPIFMYIKSEGSFDSDLLHQTENVCDTLTFLHVVSCCFFFCTDMGEQFLDLDFQDMKIAKFETLAQMVCCPIVCHSR